MPMPPRLFRSVICLLPAISALGAAEPAFAQAPAPATPGGADAGARRALAVRTVERLLERAEKEPAEKVALLAQARGALGPELEEAAEQDEKVLTLAGRLAVLGADRDLAARAFAGIARVRPNFHEDAGLLDLMADLNALRAGGAAPKAERALPTTLEPEEPSADLTHFDELRLQNFGLAERVNEIARTGRFEAWKRDAEAGNAVAMTLVGLAYQSGAGAEKSDAKALEWYQKAAKARNPRAMLLLGTMCEDGIAVPKDDGKAAAWYREAADLGTVPAMAYLADMYRQGAGVAQDHAEAMRWYLKAAEGGYPDAMFELGLMHAAGMGTPASDTEAAKWYRKAAGAGNTRAMNNLAVLCVRGSGVERDVAQALALLRKGAAAGNAAAMRNLAVMYVNGTGVAPHRAEAERWVRRAEAARQR